MNPDAPPDALRGYPVDLRSDRRRAHANRSPAGDFEAAAARVVARYTGAEVCIQDDGRAERMVDLRIDYDNGTTGFAEVTVDLDADYARMQAQISPVGHLLPLPALTRQWWLTVDGRFRRSRLDSDVVAVLVAMEQAGETFEWVSTTELSAHESDRVRALADVGVVRVSSREAPESEPGGVFLGPDGTSSALHVTWEPFDRWIRTTLFSRKLRDVRLKLGMTGAAERHVVLGVTFTSPGEVWFKLDERTAELPDRPPRLPAEITHLWVMQAPPLGRCLHWAPDTHWRDVSRHWRTS